MAVDGNAGEPLRRLLDAEEIARLKARYFRFLDTKDWEAFGALFTADAVMEADGYVREGRQAIIDFLPPILAQATTVHHGHMPEITFTGPDEAEGVWAMDDYLEFPGSGPPSGFHGYGHYHDRYVRTVDGWRLAAVRLTRLRVDPLPGGLPGGDGH